MRRCVFLFLLLPTLSWAVSLVWSADAGRAYYPDGYHRWTLAKFKFIGPENPQWQSQGGLRHHFANETALASWGKFREGSVIVDERVHTSLNERKVWVETGPAHVAVMRKEGASRADTGGWYFNIFMEGDTTRGITHVEARARCFEACHRAQEARDFVFSDPRL